MVVVAVWDAQGYSVVCWRARCCRGGGEDRDEKETGRLKVEERKLEMEDGCLGWLARLLCLAT